MSETRPPGRPRAPNALVATLATRVTEREEREAKKLAAKRRMSLADLLRLGLSAVRRGLV